MPDGACVIRYNGKRGTVWRVKYRDASGRQVKETLGSAADGWTKKKAEAALRAKLTDVERDAYIKPETLTFETFADRFVDEHLPTRNLKRSTLIDYTATLENHLKPAFDGVALATLEHQPELVERYVRDKLAEGLSAKTIRNHLALLGRMFRIAKRWRLVRENPVEMIDPPKGDETEAEVLTDVEVAELLAGFRQLERDAAASQDEEERREAAWWALTRRVVTVAIGTGLRRGELLGLRWGDCSLLEQRLNVRQAWVRNEMTTPKSRTSRRKVDLVEGGHVLGALEEQWQASRYRSDDSLVFCHPALGTPLDPSKLSRYVRKALKVAGIAKPFRPFHGLRHTTLTHAAAVNPHAYVTMLAGHSSSAITDRYVHAAQVAFPGAAERGEARVFGSVPSSGTNLSDEATSVPTSPDVIQLPGLDSNQQPSG